MKVHLEPRQRWITALIIALATVMTAVTCEKIFGDGKLAPLWFFPAIGFALLAVVFGYFMTPFGATGEATASTVRAGTVSVSAGTAVLLVLGLISVALNALDEPADATGGATAGRAPNPATSAVPKGGAGGQGDIVGDGNAVGQGNIIGNGNVVEENHFYQNNNSNSHPTCAEGSICLWSGRGYTGTMWKWTPGKDKDGPLPDPLRNHLGSFVSAADGCFVDSATQMTRTVKPTHFSGRYIETYGADIDTIRARC